MLESHPQCICHIVSLVQKSVARLRRIVNTTIQRFTEKRGSLENLDGRKLASSSAGSQYRECYDCALNRIAITYWACAYGNKRDSKWLPSLRLWACTIDKIGSGRSDARRKWRHRGPARYKMERIYV